MQYYTRGRVFFFVVFFLYRRGIENKGERCMVRAEDGMDYVELGIGERNILELCLRFLVLSTV